MAETIKRRPIIRDVPSSSDLMKTYSKSVTSFKGIQNTRTPIEMPVGTFADAENVYVDEDYKFSTRKRLVPYYVPNDRYTIVQCIDTKDDCIYAIVTLNDDVNATLHFVRIFPSYLEINATCISAQSRLFALGNTVYVTHCISSDIFKLFVYKNNTFTSIIADAYIPTVYRDVSTGAAIKTDTYGNISESLNVFSDKLTEGESHFTTTEPADYVDLRDRTQTYISFPAISTQHGNAVPTFYGLNDGQYSVNIDTEYTLSFNHEYVSWIRNGVTQTELEISGIPTGNRIAYFENTFVYSKSTQKVKFTILTQYGAVDGYFNIDPYGYAGAVSLRLYSSTLSTSTIERYINEFATAEYDASLMTRTNRVLTTVQTYSYQLEYRASIDIITVETDFTTTTPISTFVAKTNYKYATSNNEFDYPNNIDGGIVFKVSNTDFIFATTNKNGTYPHRNLRVVANYATNTYTVTPIELFYNNEIVATSSRGFITATQRISSTSFYALVLDYDASIAELQIYDTTTSTATRVMQYDIEGDVSDYGYCSEIYIYDDINEPLYIVEINSTWVYVYYKAKVTVNEIDYVYYIKGKFRFVSGTPDRYKYNFSKPATRPTAVPFGIYGDNITISTTVAELYGTNGSDGTSYYDPVVAFTSSIGTVLYQRWSEARTALSDIDGVYAMNNMVVYTSNGQFAYSTAYDTMYVDPYTIESVTDKSDSILEIFVVSPTAAIMLTEQSVYWLIGSGEGELTYLKPVVSQFELHGRKRNSFSRLALTDTPTILTDDGVMMFTGSSEVTDTAQNIANISESIFKKFESFKSNEVSRYTYRDKWFNIYAIVTSNETKILLYDAREGHWWSWRLPVTSVGIYRIDDDICLQCYNGVMYQLTDESRIDTPLGAAFYNDELVSFIGTSYTTTDYKVSWYAESHAMALDVVARNKSMHNIVVALYPDSTIKNYMCHIDFEVYARSFIDSRPYYSNEDIHELKTIMLRTYIPKFQYIAFRLFSSEASTVYEKLSLASLTFEYKVLTRLN